MIEASVSISSVDRACVLEFTETAAKDSRKRFLVRWQTLTQIMKRLAEFRMSTRG